MMPPFPSIETRWFFTGDSSRHGELRQWFESCAPFSRSRARGAPEWKRRRGGEPDIYLLMPGCNDMGIKWREGTLQIKGRVADLGVRSFGSRHAGRVQRWIKWTYADVPAGYRALFETGEGQGLDTAAVHKMRALRMISLDAATPEEVVPGTVLDRGVGFEMTDLELEGERYCSIGFEAFPDDAQTGTVFDVVVGAFVAEFAGTLGSDTSMSYPAWLGG